MGCEDLHRLQEVITFQMETLRGCITEAMRIFAFAVHGRAGEYHSLSYAAAYFYE